MTWPDDYINQIICGDALEVLKTIPDQAIQTCVTSPPYWKQRDYHVDRQLGLENSPFEYIEKIKAVFMEVYRVLRRDGTLWLNLGDKYISAKGSCFNPGGGYKSFKTYNRKKHHHIYSLKRPDVSEVKSWGLKHKDMALLPWRIGIALQEFGYYLRSDIIWNKTSCLPESAKDRPTKAHEYILLLSKSERYYFDLEAIREKYDKPLDRWGGDRKKTSDALTNPNYKNLHRQREMRPNKNGRHPRSVWSFKTESYKKSHFATFPEELARRCILAGSRLGDIVYDPFMGSGTVAFVALQYGRNYAGSELNPKDIKIINSRVRPLGNKPAPQNEVLHLEGV